MLRQIFTNPGRPTAALLPALLSAWIAWSCGAAEGPGAAVAAPPAGILLLVADDMSWDTPGCYGGGVPEVTPRIDRLAAEGLRFEEAHVQVSVCQPSRMALLTGRFPHASGGVGFDEDLRVPGVPHLPGLLQAAGWRVGVLGKLQHSTPYAEFEWDLAVGRRELAMGRSPRLFAEHARRFLAEAAAAGAPFFLMANSHDPHRPLHGQEGPRAYQGENPLEHPSRTYTREECPVPDFLPDLPEVRDELVAYHESSRRCDDTVGALLGVLDELGLADSTLVVFLSDNGMPFPFAKASCYPQGTRVPWIVRWPGRVAPGTVAGGVVQGVDLTPTLLELCGLPVPDGVQGRSFAAALAGGAAPWDSAFVQYHESSAGVRYPMRALHRGGRSLVVNLWSDGEREFERGEQEVNRSYQALEAGAQREPALAARLRHLRFRSLEELYDTDADPGCVRELASDSSRRAELEALREELEAWMRRVGDPLLEEYLARRPVR
jgi:N-sulfoglucosamine sulfohydrolase